MVVGGREVRHGGHHLNLYIYIILYTTCYSPGVGGMMALATTMTRAGFGIILTSVMTEEKITQT